MAAKTIAYNQFRIVDAIYDEYEGWSHDFWQGQGRFYDDPDVIASIHRDAVVATARHYNIPEDFVDRCIDMALSFYDNWM